MENAEGLSSQWQKMEGKALSKSEKAIQAEILMAITAEERAMFWREVSAKAWVGRLIERKGSRVVLEAAMPVTAGVPGIADIMGIYDGRAVGIEVKTQTGKQEQSQRQFERVFTSKGGFYTVARSVDEALQFLRDTVR